MQVLNCDDIPLESIGGRRQSCRALLEALAFLATDRVLAKRYGLAAGGFIIIEGPPGTGKSLMVRAAVRELGRMTGCRPQLAIADMREWPSRFVGETERRVRATFGELEAVAKISPALVLCLQGIDAVGWRSGGVGGHHADRFLACLLAELGSIRCTNVAIVLETSRVDRLDASLRMASDIVIHIEPPATPEEVREIMSIHLPESTRCATDPRGASDGRARLIDVAVSRLFDPGAPHTEVAEIGFWDGTRRLVCAADLLSGRLLAQVCHDAAARASRREPASPAGAPRLLEADMIVAVDAAIDHLRATLDVDNVRDYLRNIAADVAVAAVDPITRGKQAR